MPRFKYSGVFMDKKCTKDSVEKNAKGVMMQLYNTIVNMDVSLANKVLYWLNDWSGYILPNEKVFKYNELIKYEQYCIVEINLGFNVGSEAGGLHYGVIIDKDNSKSSRNVMIIPFKSLGVSESEEDIDQKTEVYLGNNVFEKEIIKQKQILSKIEFKLKKYNVKNNNIIMEKDENYKKLLKKKTYIEAEIAKFSQGTIAQVGQMHLISKMRIYYPTSTSEKLYGLKLSDENIIRIKNKFDELYF